jgi:hypothetical protein
LAKKTTNKIDIYIYNSPNNIETQAKAAIHKIRKKAMSNNKCTSYIYVVWYGASGMCIGR